MKTMLRLLTPFVVIFLLFGSVVPCGPAILTPIFDYKKAPENPYENFAGGRIGIVKPTYRRTVLFGAYRYLTGGGFNGSEQQQLVKVWNNNFKQEDIHSNEIDKAVKDWVEKRKSVAGDEEELPKIYVEREYGGYDFFPNCTQNAFETAIETLSDRSLRHGSTDRYVKEWLAGQDAVFSNCGEGSSMPDQADMSMPDWLQKDRAYQVAAAEFYATKYDDAKRHFKEIAADSDSPWSETAEYLVARTLIRQASLSKAISKADVLYNEAEQILNKTRSGKFGPSSEGMINLIKYRTRPEERVRELAGNLTTYGTDSLAQDLIDYTWLLDKFESDAYIKEGERRTDEEIANGTIPESSNAVNAKKTKDNISISFYLSDAKKWLELSVPPETTESDLLLMAATKSENPLSEDDKKAIVARFNDAYGEKFGDASRQGYQGRYYGDIEPSVKYLPDFVMMDDLSDWLISYQIEGNEAYLHSLQRYEQGGREHWLIAALSKAETSSTKLDLLLDAASKLSRNSPAYPTAVYHYSRIKISQGKTDEARKMLDDVLSSTASLPVSTVNQFMKMRQDISTSLDEFLHHALRKPFAYENGGDAQSIAEVIAQRKSYYDPKYDKVSREEFDKKIDEEYRHALKFENGLMLDYTETEIINENFPISKLAEAMNSPALPENVKDSFAIAVWTKAVLLGDIATANKAAPRLAASRPDLAQGIKTVMAAKAGKEQKDAAVFFMISNPILSPYVQYGLGKTDIAVDNWSTENWWCNFSYDDPDALPKTRPPFITAAEHRKAKAESSTINELGDAPQYLARFALDHAKTNPKDARLAEAFYSTYVANGWTKYGCGNNRELQKEIIAAAQKLFPGNEWTAKILNEESHTNDDN